MIDRGHWQRNRPWLDQDHPDIGSYVAALSDRSGFDLQRLHCFTEASVLSKANMESAQG
jgi:hypothetical protein